jgi:hypothetical protein
MKKIKVGFDLDGVLLYNPARIVRAPVVQFKHKFFPKKEKVFYVPSTPPERFLWHIFHLSSIFIAGGFSDIKKLREKGIIEPYLVTARYDFLKPDLKRWLRLMKAHDTFEGVFMNENNMQPHLYKEKMVKRLGLDVFVEDNWDVVSHLNKTTTSKNLWIYNIFDRSIHYPLRFPSLKKAVTHIEKTIASNGKK